MQTQQSQADQAHATRANYTIPCRVSVTTATGDRHHYYALSRSTCAAVMDALDIFGICKVRVQSLRRSHP